MSPVIPVLIFHILCCLCLLLLEEKKILKCGREDVLLSLFVPVFGPASAVIRSWFYRRQERIKARENGIEELKIDDEIKKSIEIEEDEDADSLVPISEALIVNDPSTRRALVKDVMFEVTRTLDQEAGNQDFVVPLSEALLVNDPEERRRLIMDVLYSDPSLYIRQLMAAKNNEDSEVVHYAVTALVVIQKDYEQKFQDLRRRQKEEPENMALLYRYQHLCEQYLGTGLLEGDSRTEQLLIYLDVLKKRLEKESTMSLWAKKAQVDEELKKLEDLKEDAQMLLQINPDIETGYLYQIRACALCKDRSGIDETIRQIQKKRLHLSSKGRAELRFWLKESKE